MCQPTTLVLALALLLGTAARAQPSPAREQRQRTVTVTGNPAEPPHEIYVAKGVATLLRLKTQINRDAVTVDGRGTRIAVDVGDSSIILEPLIELGSAERLVASVTLADGQRVVFVLVSSPSEVDARIDVVRREQTVESCQAELAAAGAQCGKISPMTIVRSGLVDGYGVQVRAITSSRHVSADGLSFKRGKSYCAGSWVLVAVKIRNEGAPWILREAVLRSAKTGERVAVRSIEMEHEQVASGETGSVFVETEAPLKSAGSDFVLELSDTASGRSLSIPHVTLDVGE